MLMRHDLDLRLLRAFATVVDRGGFSAAAVVLHITQPALSRRVGELESALGLRLLERTSRRVRLTRAGEDLLARCRDILLRAEGLGERAEALVAGRAGILRVGCAPFVMESVVAPFLGAYRKRCPGVDVKLHEQGGGRAQEAVARGELHAAVASPTEPGLQTRLLFPWRLLAVVPDGHSLASGRTVDIQKLAKEPILTLPAGFGTRALFDAACETADIHPAIRMEAAAAQTLVAAARAGHGVAIVPSLLAFGRRAVKALPVLAAGKSLGRWMAVAWNAEPAAAPYLLEFADLLAECLKRHYPGREYQFAPAIDAPRSLGRKSQPPASPKRLMRK
jgi:LysR family nitrogen assimilation transcriptional regulator